MAGELSGLRVHSDHFCMWITLFCTLSLLPLLLLLIISYFISVYSKLFFSQPLMFFCFQLEVGWRGNSESTKLEKTISKPWQVRHSAFVDRIKVEISSYTGSTTRTEQLLDDESMKIYLLWKKVKSNIFLEQNIFIKQWAIEGNKSLQMKRTVKIALTLKKGELKEHLRS